MEQNNPLFIAFQQGYARRNSNNFSKDWDEFKTNHADLFQPPSPAKAEQEGPHIRKEDIEEEWENFWKDIVCHPDGSLNIDQIKKELYDFSYVMGEVPKVYCEITGNRLSKIMYPAETVISVADEYTQSLIDRELKDYEHDVQDFVETAEPKREQEGLRWVKASERLPEVHADNPVIVRSLVSGMVRKTKHFGRTDGWDVGMEPDFQYNNTEWLDESTPPVKEVEPIIPTLTNYATEQGMTEGIYKMLYKKAAVWNDQIMPHMLKGLLNGWCLGYRAAREVTPAKEGTRLADFQTELETMMSKLPYTKHLDDGQYNDGQLTGFELGANWALHYIQPIKEAGQPRNLPIEELIKLSDEELNVEINKVRSRLGMGKSEEAGQPPEQQYPANWGHGDYEGYVMMLQNRIKELESRQQPAPSGFRWVPITQWGKVKRDITKVLVKYDTGEIRRFSEDDQPANLQTHFMDLSDSPAPVQVNLVAFANWICEQAYYPDQISRNWAWEGCIPGQEITTECLLEKYIQSLQNNKP